MADTPTKQLVTRGGRHLPEAAWRTAVAAHGPTILEDATFVPETVAIELTDRDEPLPYKTAVTLAKASHGKVLPRLAADRRATVQTALVESWKLDGPAIDVLLNAGPTADVLAKLKNRPMDLARRARLWSAMAAPDALADALRFHDVLEPHSLEPLLAAELPDDVVPTVAALLRDHPELVAYAAEHGSDAAAAAAACLREGATAAEALLGRPVPRSFGYEGLHVTMLLALADHPATPLEARREALSRAQRIGTTEHLRMAVLPDAVPYVATPESWGDDAARATVVRAVRASPGLSWRLWHLLEVIEAPSVSDELRSVAAYRFWENCLIGTSWSTVVAPLEQTMSSLLDPTTFSRWQVRIRDNEQSLSRPATSCPEAPVPPVALDVRIPSTDKVGEWTMAQLIDSRAGRAACYLAEAVGDNDASWRLLWELIDGFEGTLSDLAAMVNVA